MTGTGPDGRTVVVVAPYYLPGYRGGGPIRSIERLTSMMPEVHWRILTRNHDLGVRRRYSASQIRGAELPGHVTVDHLRRPFSLWLAITLVRLLRGTCGTLYLNSFFDPSSAIALLVARVFGGQWTLVLAPRGEFSPGALTISTRKKDAYRWLLTRAHLLQGAILQASTALEVDDIKNYLREAAGDRQVRVGADLPRATVGPQIEKMKLPGNAVFAFYSRISPMKNLPYAIELLARLGCRHPNSRAELWVIGPIEDGPHWAHCEELARRLPTNVAWKVFGGRPAGEGVALMSEADFLLLPTLGENYGHVIAEALQQRVPCVISDRTPWKLGPDAGGWAIALEDGAAWDRALDECLGMTPREYSHLQRSCGAALARVAEAPTSLDLFRSLV